MILKTIEEIEEYIENLRVEIYLKRIKIERLDVTEGSHKYPKAAELELSNYYSNKTTLEKGTYDEYVINLKEESMIEMIKNYPLGLKINDMGGYFPIIDTLTQ